MNIVLIITDQQRGDALSCAGHPVVETPAIDRLAAEGTRFPNAYSECPVCIPARRTWMTGQTPAHQGVTFNYNTHLEGPTLPGVLADHGYQSHLAGKLHLWPERKLYGFHSMDLADGPGTQGNLATNDHARDLARRGIFLDDAGRAHGMTGNTWNARPWHLSEDLHPTAWCVSKAIDFLERRDPTLPFFLNVGIFHPHPPCTPPEHYFRRYLERDLPEPVEADWSRLYDAPRTGFPLNMAGYSRSFLPPETLRRFRAAYYAEIAFIDDQLQRLLQRIPEDTMVIFTSDHGEMLGDHQFSGKCVPYEPSANIPLIIRPPGTAKGFQRDRVCDTPVQLMDLMPTALEAAGAPIPDTVDGLSLMPLLRGESVDRDCAHGEIARVAGLGSGAQYLTDGKEKYIWWPGFGTEQLFDLVEDPLEQRDLSGDAAAKQRMEPWRARLADRLQGRPEGFVRDGRLAKLDGATPYCLPGHEQTPGGWAGPHPEDPPVGLEGHPAIGTQL
jgi:arylsulfatase